MKARKPVLIFGVVWTFLGMTLLFLAGHGSSALALVEKAGQMRPYEFILHDLSVDLDLEKHYLKATDTIIVRTKNQKLDLFIHSAFKIISARCGGCTQDLEFDVSKKYDLSDFIAALSDDIRERYDNAALLSIKIPRKILKRGDPIKISVTYEGVLYDPPKRAEFSRQNIADQTTGIIGEEGVYLSEASHWYPSFPHALNAFRLVATVPSSYEVVSEGNFVGKAEEKERTRIQWNVPYPIEALHLVAGKYVVTRSDHNGIEVSTYFFPEEQHLSERYIEAVKRYLKMYEEMIGPYPYKKFSVVENFFPTGYGMPSFTLLGREVIKLPFIIGTSLGHEVLHNWWGNSVFVDYEKGNWCEGLTTYLADYHYKKLESLEAAEQYRREICRDYTNYVTSTGEDFPLSSFHERTTPATRAIGYGKSLMVFHMLRKLVGEEAFYGAIREFYAKNLWKHASWNDIHAVFKEKTNLDLNRFFAQWITQKGAPGFKIAKADWKKEEGRYIVQLQLAPDDCIFPFALTVEIETEKGRETFTRQVALSPPLNPGHLPAFVEEEYAVDALPLSINVDPHQDVFRRLSPEEIPPILSGFLGDAEQLVIMADENDASLTQTYRQVAAGLTGSEQLEVMKIKDVSDEDLGKSSVLVLGNISKVERLRDAFSSFSSSVSLLQDSFILNGKQYGRDSSLLFSIKNPWNRNKVLTLFVGFDPGTVEASGRKLAHYGKYSYLAFTSGENKDKGVLPIETSPLVHRFDE